MKKNDKIVMVIVLAVVMSILAGISIFMFLSPQRTTIYVFKDNYTAGRQITAEMLSPVQVDSNVVVAGKKTKTDQSFITQKEYQDLLKTGDSLKIDVSQGMPLMTSMLSITGGNSIVMTMKPSAVAVTVDVNDVTGVTNELSSGSNVNVYVVNRSGGSYLLFENMRVLSVFKSTSGELNSATLEVTNEQAVRLIDASKAGTVHLGLVNSNGYQYEDGAAPKTTQAPNTP